MPPVRVLEKRRIPSSEDKVMQEKVIAALENLANPLQLTLLHRVQLETFIVPEYGRAKTERITKALLNQDADPNAGRKGGPKR